MIRVYSVDNKKFSYDIQNALHSIKYDGVVDLRLTEDCIYGDKNFLSLSREEKERLGCLAVYIAVSFQNRGMKPPMWSLSKRIWLEPAYVHRHCINDDVEDAFEPSKLHNVFVPLVSFEVL